MTKRIIKLASLVSVLVMLAGCGQKGPLYMPPERETTDVEPEPSSASEGATNQVEPAADDYPGAG